MTRRWLVGVVAVLMLVASACGNKDSGKQETKGGSGDAGPSVKVQERDFAITLDGSVPAGKVSFKVRNNGPSTHEFVIFRSDLEAGKLPTKSDGTVDEEGAGVEHVDELEDIGSGKSKTLSADLTAGKYVAICNIAGHYAAGMRLAFTVG